MSTEMSTASWIYDTPNRKSSFLPVVENVQKLNRYRHLGFQLVFHICPTKSAYFGGFYPQSRHRLTGTIEAPEQRFRWQKSLGRVRIMILLTIEDTMSYLNVSKSTVLRLIHDEAFDVIRIGRVVRIPREALDRFIDQQTTYARVPGVAS